MDKLLIAERFAKARNTYTHEARVQLQVALKMTTMLSDCLLAKQPKGRSLEQVIEFGCGTGSYSRILRSALQPKNLLVNDLCPEMKEYVEAVPSVSFLAGDAETIDFPTGIDLITSCSTLQWFNDPAHFFASCHRFLADNGILAFSTFGPENMLQIRSLTGHGLSYLPLNDLESLLAPYFDILHTEEEIVSLPFETPLHVLKHLKQTGVTGTEKRTWTRGVLQNFCTRYAERFATPTGAVTLTYHPIYIIAQKKKKA